jgi:hypothetical protein
VTGSGCLKEEVFGRRGIEGARTRISLVPHGVAAGEGNTSTSDNRVARVLSNVKVSDPVRDSREQLSGGGGNPTTRRPPGPFEWTRRHSGEER